MRADVIYPERPWTFFKQPFDSIWFIKPGRQIGPGVILTEEYRVENPHSDQDRDTGAYYALTDCKHFRVAAVLNVAELKDPNYNPKWQDVGQGPDIQGIQLFIAECKPYYPNEAAEADKKCVNSTALMKPRNATSCTPEGLGQIPVQETPFGGENSGILLMTPSKWADLTDDQQGLYVKAFLETVSFSMYGDYLRNSEGVKDFSDWTACAEHEQPSRWNPLVDWLFGKLDRTAASQYFKMVHVVCKKYVGKGDKTWSPVRLISKKEWSILSRSDKAIYVTGYVETADEFLRMTKQSDQARRRRLENCVASRGVEGIM